MTAPPRVAIVGVGRQGRKHLQAILDLQHKHQAHLVGVCDVIDIDKNFSAPFFSDYKQMMIKTKPQVLVIAVPNIFHQQMIQTAFIHHIDVIKEKPLGIDLATAQQVVSLAKKQRRLMITTQQRYFSPVWLRVKKELKKLGQIRSIDYFYSLNDTGYSWYWDRHLAGGGSWLNMGWHGVALIQWLCGQIVGVDLATNSGGHRPWSYTTDHTAFAKIKLKEGISGRILVSCVLPKEELLQIKTAKGLLTVDENSIKICQTSQDKVVTCQSDKKTIYSAQLLSYLGQIHDRNYDMDFDLSHQRALQAGWENRH